MEFGKVPVRGLLEWSWAEGASWSCRSMVSVDRERRTDRVSRECYEAR